MQKRLLLSIVTVIGLLAILCCSSTPPPALKTDEMQMLSHIEEERGKRCSLVASQLLHQTKAVEMQSGKQKAYDYLMRAGVRYPVEALTIRQTLYPELPETSLDRELQMLANIQAEKGERYALIAYKFLVQTKAVNTKSGKQSAIEYLHNIGRTYPYEALKIREIVFPEDKKTLANTDHATYSSTHQTVAKSQEETYKPYAQRLQTTKSREEKILENKYRKKFALIIGISDYENQGKDGLTNLLFADDDANDFAQALEKIGWSQSHIKKLVNEEATKRNIQIALESWLTKAGPNDVIVVFWAGHGFPDPEDPQKVYFACYDTEISIPATGYRMDRVRRSLEERKARNVLFFGDTCHAGKLITRGERQNSVASHLKSLREQKKIPKGWIFMVGAETDRYALESSSWSNGAFTHCLIEGIQGKADGFESMGKKDGIVTMRELQGYLNAVMPEKTQKAIGVARRPLITTTTGDSSIWDLSLED